MRGFGRCPSPLPGERLRFLGSADSRLMKLAPLTAVKAARARQHHPRAMTRPDGAQYRGRHPGLVSGEMS